MQQTQRRKRLPRNDSLMNYFILLFVVANNSILYLSVNQEEQKNSNNKIIFLVPDLIAKIFF